VYLSMDVLADEKLQTGPCSLEEGPPGHFKNRRSSLPICESISLRSCGVGLTEGGQTVPQNVGGVMGISANRPALDPTRSKMQAELKGREQREVIAVGIADLAETKRMIVAAESIRWNPSALIQTPRTIAGELSRARRAMKTGSWKASQTD
jgi:hypothetical protein